MDPRRNPYSPGAGRPPAALVGRDVELLNWQVALDRVQTGLTVQPVALFGLRGVGKTVLLTAMSKQAESHGWIVAQIEAATTKPLRVTLGEALYGPLTDMARPSAGLSPTRALKTALSFKASYDSTGTWSFGLDLDDVAGGADSGVLETDLDKLIKDLSAAAGENGVGLAVLDEAQRRAELVALCAIAHKASQQNWPFLLCLAGLPSLPKDVAEASPTLNGSSRSTRSRPCRRSSPVVLTRPAKQANVTWEEAAVAHIVDEAQGYPYFLQQYGQDSCNRAHGSRRGHGCRCPGRRCPRPQHPGQRLLPGTLGPSHPQRTGLPESNGSRRRRRQLLR